MYGLEQLFVESKRRDLGLADRRVYRVGDLQPGKEPEAEGR